MLQLIGLVTMAMQAWWEGRGWKKPTLMQLPGQYGNCLQFPPPFIMCIHVPESEETGGGVFSLASSGTRWISSAAKLQAV